MNYRFINRYSYADAQVWGVEIRNVLCSPQQRNLHVLVAVAIQGVIWVGCYLLLEKTGLSPLSKAMLGFFALLLVSHFYENYVMEFVVRYLDTPEDDVRPEEFESVIDVTDDGITSTQDGQTVFHAWSKIYAVHDTEKNVLLISDTLHPVIPAKCFASFLEKDAFVRACQQKIPGYERVAADVFA